MTSQINTNGINANYPTPGVNQSSQGFRDNFAQIKQQLDTGSSEITDLQNKVLLKAALNNTTLNNDMANALISNASTSGFRSTTYNLGNALAGTVLVDVNKADVQYGAVTGNVILQFGNWAPTNTQSNVVLRLSYANTSASITFPNAAVSSNNNFGVTLLENYANVGGFATITAPANASIIEYRFSSLDCGNTITVEPINRPYQTTQVISRNIPPTGLPGDVNGTVAVGEEVTQLTISTTNASDYFTTTDTSQLYPDLPVVFTGTSMEANITVGTTYYVRNVVSNTNFTVSSTIGGGNVNLAGNVSPSSAMYANPGAYLYVSTTDYNSTAYTKSVTNTNTSGNITVNNTTNLQVNSPVVFTGNVFGGIEANTVYYVKSIDGGAGNIKIAYSRNSGIAGTEVSLTTATGTCTATCYVGSDIWRRIQLSSW